MAPSWEHSRDCCPRSTGLRSPRLGFFSRRIRLASDSDFQTSDFGFRPWPLASGLRISADARARGTRLPRVAVARMGWKPCILHNGGMVSVGRRREGPHGAQAGSFVYSEARRTDRPASASPVPGFPGRGRPHAPGYAGGCGAPRGAGLLPSTAQLTADRGAHGWLGGLCLGSTSQSPVRKA
ncbi:Hypothetical protein GLP15_4513 [Giardia lamblia P15]|uniref:Uncharacterized protein n=1 Tax=Giardia intestinalis (strain P15) TaxID=658858 RepID=E1F9M6_GIAIA|nr:Hypothetical protein GLP15_4513 [Giardia lamblia P15]